MTSDAEDRFDEPPKGTDADPALGRREFLRTTGTAALGVGALGVTQRAWGAPKERKFKLPSIKRYRKLGNTGLEISDIGFGSGGCKNADLVRFCFNHGINYFDTAEMYHSEGWSSGEKVETLIGQALQGKRDKVVITTKFIAEKEHTRDQIMSELEASLARLKTDYVDIYLNHAVNDIDRMTSDGWLEFVELAKKQGKIRFSGMSGHGGNLQNVLDYVLDHDLAEVILVSHNFGTDPAFYERFTKHFDLIANQKGLPRLLEKAHSKGVGVIAMKTQMGAKVNDLSRYQADGAPFERAAFRWVFSDPNIDAAIVSMKNWRLAASYIACSGDAGLQTSDRQMLERYIAETHTDYCRPGCDRCESSCPHEVPVADVLRQRMYQKRYGNRRMALEGYARLEVDASACLGCSGSPCLGACPYGVDVSRLTRETARRLG